MTLIKIVSNETRLIMLVILRRFTIDQDCTVGISSLNAMRSGLSEYHASIGHTNECRWLRRTAVHALTTTLDEIQPQSSIEKTTLYAAREMMRMWSRWPEDNYPPCSEQTGKYAMNGAIKLAIERLTGISRLMIESEFISASNDFPLDWISKWHDRMLR